jgi:hypothetical protein
MSYSVELGAGDIWERIGKGSAREGQEGREERCPFPRMLSRDSSQEINYRLPRTKLDNMAGLFWAKFAFFLLR